MADANSTSSIQRVFETPSESPYGYATTFGLGVSDNGRYVLMFQYMTFHDDTSPQYCKSVGVVDLQTGVRQGVAGICDLSGNSTINAQLSADGRFVAVATASTNIINADKDDSDLSIQIFLYDLQSDSAKIVSLSPSGERANNGSRLIGFSDDGRYIVFSSTATNLVPNDTNGSRDYFLYDALNDTIRQVGNSDVPDYYRPDYRSADSRFFIHSTEDPMTTDDTNGRNDVFVYDKRAGNAIRLVSVSTTGEQGNYDSGAPSISANGQYILFHSSATNLVPDDTNGESDIFIAVNPFMEGVSNEYDEDDCIIPPSGPWPECAKQGSSGTPSQPPADAPDNCSIPSSGPWPPCAIQGDPPPANLPSNCVIPPSGPWPECAR